MLGALEPGHEEVGMGVARSPVPALFWVSVALFLAGIGFIIAGARASRAANVGSGFSRSSSGEAPAEPRPPAVASLKQIMTGIVAPNATVVYDSVGTTISKEGIKEIAPANDKEWAVVSDSAAALVESGQMMLHPDRAIDNGDWMRMTRDFIAASQATLKAATEKRPDGIMDSGETLNASCDACHGKYDRR